MMRLRTAAIESLLSTWDIKPRWYCTPSSGLSLVAIGNQPMFPKYLHPSPQRKAYEATLNLPSELRRL
jgi:hypothetical protein